MPLPPTSDLALAITAATLTPLPDEPWYRSVDLAVVVNLGVHVCSRPHESGRIGHDLLAPVGGSFEAASDQSVFIGLPFPSRLTVAFLLRQDSASMSRTWQC